MKNSAIVLAGGKGERFGDKKQFVEINGVPLWKMVADKAKNVVDEVVVVGVDVVGGETRADSVFIGLENIKGKNVVILESARPLVTEQQIYDILKAVETHISATYITPCVNTIYENGEYKRNGIVELQVPQAFRRSKLLTAHKITEKHNPTDDTQLIYDIFGIKPHLLIGGRNLFKVTYPEDIKIIQSML